ncbi:beta-ketoacyl synthase chain length factor [Ferrimonas sp. YFM]|uniref:beta-ketoacyl synthase chain length factor n=1 Tax=Ferrimonas sp. YFM TaxID=3028878 RepID=UPI0025746784|nr:beta-ketoacyl synthase chain length factor [Ferrimonas sp. YFM]BDY04377.1 hypothetical protein F0521_14180 [Ferrimonas sp. YFM]
MDLESLPEYPWKDEGDAPVVSVVPAMQRRRLTRLSKMALHVASFLDESHDLPSVFASQHGEVAHTMTMLNGIFAGEAPSPTKFSQSVHNSASGAYGIHFSNQAPSTSIAAGRDTLFSALVEARAMLEPGRDVLVIYVDVPLPERFRGTEEPAIALGIRLSLNGVRQLVAETTTDAPEPCDQPAWQLLSLLHKGEGESVVTQERQRVRWSLES